MFTYSVPLPTNIYNIEDYFSRFLPRIHQNADLADEGSYHTQSDWVKAGGSIQSVGSVNAHAGNFTALIAAESLPDRLELVSYVIEYGFTLDDVTDSTPAIEELLRRNAQFIVDISVSNGNDSSDSCTLPQQDMSGKRILQYKTARSLLEVDKELGKEILEEWGRHVGYTTKIRQERNIQTLDEYLDYRIFDTGAEWTLSLARFACKIHLTADEKTAIAPIVRQAFSVCALTNDYFSWDKEYQTYLTHQSQDAKIINAISYFMNWHSVDTNEAKSLLRKEIIDREILFEGLRDCFCRDHDPSENVARYFVTLEQAIAGNHVWSLKTPRYMLS